MNIRMRKLFSRDYFFVGVIICFSIFLKLIFFMGPGLGDPFSSFQHAYNLTKGRYEFITAEIVKKQGWSPHHAFRFTNLIPLSIFFRFFGVNEFSAVLWPMLCSAGLILVVFLIGKRLFDSMTGIMAAFLTSFFPYHVIYSTQFLPDIPLAFFSALGIYLILIATEKNDSLLYFATGFSLFLGYYIRETALFVVPVILLIVRIGKGNTKKYVALATGFLLPYVLVGLFYKIRFGSFFLREIAMATARRYLEAGIYFNYDWFWYIKEFFRWNTGLSNYYFLLIPGAVLLLAKNRKVFTILVFWLISNYLLLELTSNLMGTAKTMRYTLTLEPPLLLIVGFLLKHKLKDGKWIKIAISAAVMAEVLLMSYLTLTDNYLNFLRNFWCYVAAITSFLTIVGILVLVLSSGTLGRLSSASIIVFLTLMLNGPASEKVYQRNEERKYKRICGTLLKFPKGNVYISKKSYHIKKYNFYLKYKTDFKLFGGEPFLRNPEEPVFHVKFMEDSKPLFDKKASNYIVATGQDIEARFMKGNRFYPLDECDGVKLFLVGS